MSKSFYCYALSVWCAGAIAANSPARAEPYLQVMLADSSAFVEAEHQMDNTIPEGVISREALARSTGQKCKAKDRHGKSDC